MGRIVGCNMKEDSHTAEKMDVRNVKCHGQNDQVHSLCHKDGHKEENKVEKFAGPGEALPTE